MYVQFAGNEHKDSYVKIKLPRFSLPHQNFPKTSTQSYLNSHGNVKTPTMSANTISRIATRSMAGRTVAAVPKSLLLPPVFLAPALGMRRSRIPAPPPPSIRTQSRSFSVTARARKDHHFDTLKLVERLKEQGFTDKQSEAIMGVLGQAIEESLVNLSHHMVLREDQEKITYTQKVDFAKLRHDLSTLERTELLQTTNQYDRLTSEIDKLRSRLRDEINRTQANVRLDLNLEKGRIREESSAHELKIKETDTRIETELSQARAQLEAVKFSTLQWLIGVCTGMSAILLGVWRLLM